MRTHPRAHSLCIGVVFLGLAAAPAGAQTPIFSMPQAPVHPGPNPITQADFDLDGRADLAVGYASDSLFGTPTFVSVLLGSGTGLFAAPLDLAADKATITGVAAFDLNGDGKPDLCATRYNPIAGIRTISVWLGDGAGHFGARSDLTLTSSPLSLAIADMDGDGVLDAVTGNAGTGGSSQVLAVLLNRGNATYFPPTYYSGSASGVSVAAADLDGDGLRDVGLLGTTFFGSGSFSFVDIRRNLGGTGLGAATTLAVSGNERSLVFSDLDGDGDADGTLVTSDTNAGELRILRNDGTGTFTVEFHAYSGVGFGQAAADLDGDGVMDLAVADANFGQVDVFIGPLTAGFTNPVHYPVGQGARGISIGDVNGDGAPDVAATLTGSVALILSAPGGGFWTDPIYAVAEFAKKIAFGDLDGDGFADAVVAYAGQPILFVSPGGLSVHRGSASGIFLAKTDYPGSAPGVGTVALGDCDGDGLLDAVAANTTLAQVQFYKGNGAGALAPGAPFSTGALPADTALADLDGDGKLDIVTADSGAGTLSVLLGNGNGTFAPPIALAAGSGVTAVAVGDMDNDGRRDLICANTSANTISVFLGSAGGGFLPKADYATPGFPLSVAVGDTNYDARLDVAVACRTASVVSHRLNVGAGILGAATNYPMAATCASVFYLDWNGDGWHDLAAVAYGGEVVSIRPGDGTGSFGARSDFTGNTIGNTPFGPGSVASCGVADWNADGRTDLAILNGASLVTLQNRQPPAAATAPFGAGTSGCAGILGVSASAPAKLGTAIRLMATNAPNRTIGLGILSTAQDAAGSDFFGIGVLCHTGFATPNLLAFDAPSDPAGTAFVDFPIPNNPALAGTPAFFQGFFLTTLCKPSPFGVMSSRGLSLVFQP